MLKELTEHVRTAALAAFSPGLSSGIDRSFITVGDQWAREGCRQWVVAFRSLRRETLGAGQVPATQAVGFPAAAAASRIVDLTASFVACAPTSDSENPVPAQDMAAFAAAWLADVETIDAALSGLVLPENVTGVPGLKLAVTQGNVEPFGPSGGLARASWPLSIGVYL